MVKERGTIRAVKMEILKGRLTETAVLSDDGISGNIVSCTTKKTDETVAVDASICTNTGAYIRRIVYSTPHIHTHTLPSFFMHSNSSIEHGKLSGCL